MQNNTNTNDRRTNHAERKIVDTLGHLLSEDQGQILASFAEFGGEYQVPFGEEVTADVRRLKREGLVTIEQRWTMSRSGSVCEFINMTPRGLVVARVLNERKAVA